MAHLTLAGVSDDGKRLLLVDDKGVEFTLDIDDRLRAALRGDHARLGQLEIKMESALRPRDIQARIRAGESPETVAQAAQTSVDRIMPYAAPVIAERQHVTERAQRSSVRRRGGEAASPGGARTLGDVVSFHLRSLNVDPGTVTWDAWRREDGKWALTGEFSAGPRSGQASFTFDAPGNYVVAENDDARWLLGEQSEQGEQVMTPAAPARDDLRRARERRLTPVQAEELPLGDDAIDLVHEPAGAQASLGSEQPVEAFLDEERATREQPGVRDEPGEPEPPADEPAAESRPAPLDPDPGTSEPQPDAEKRPAKRKGRASVPSWDEIMFGGGKD